jgi:hypothetical protein
VAHDLPKEPCAPAHTHLLPGLLPTTAVTPSGPVTACRPCEAHVQALLGRCGQLLPSFSLPQLCSVLHLLAKLRCAPSEPWMDAYYACFDALAGGGGLRVQGGLLGGGGGDGPERGECGCVSSAQAAPPVQAELC